MDTVHIGGKMLYGGIGDLIYCIHHDPVLQRITAWEGEKPKLSIGTNRTTGVVDLFSTEHFSRIGANHNDHKPMMRPRAITDVPSYLQDKEVSTYPVPLDGFKCPKKPYLVAHLEVDEKDNELEVRGSLLKLVADLSRGLPVYLLGTSREAFKFPGNFIDLRAKTSLPQAYHYVKNATRYVGMTSAWYLQSVLMKKPGWSFNRNHQLLYEKMLRLYPKIELLNSRIEAYDIVYE